MQIKLYGIKNCDSFKKAKKFFDTNGIAYTFIDFKPSPPSLEQITRWSNAVGIKKLFNSRSTTYRTLNLKEIATNDVEKLSWMHKEPLLIKRPVVEYDENVLVGFNQEEYKRIFL
jgi:Spx/MgsR family transcriptional regulator